MVPLKRTIESLEKVGFSKGEAVLQVQAMVNRYTDNHAVMVNKIDGQSNETDRARASQLITLSTLLVTITGVFVAQQDIFKSMSLEQRFLALSVLMLLFLSIGAGVIGYFRDMRFFRKWQDALVGAGRAVDQGVADGSIQDIQTMHSIEAAVLSKLPNSAGESIAWVQFTLAIFGAAGFMMLLFSVLFDLSWFSLMLEICKWLLLVKF